MQSIIYVIIGILLLGLIGLIVIYATKKSGNGRRDNPDKPDSPPVLSNTKDVCDGDISKLPQGSNKDAAQLLCVGLWSSLANQISRDNSATISSILKDFFLEKNGYVILLNYLRDPTQAIPEIAYKNVMALLKNLTSAKSQLSFKGQEFLTNLSTVLTFSTNCRGSRNTNPAYFLLASMKGTYSAEGAQAMIDKEIKKLLDDSAGINANVKAAQLMELVKIYADNTKSDDDDEAKLSCCGSKVDSKDAAGNPIEIYYTDCMNNGNNIGRLPPKIENYFYH